MKGKSYRNSRKKEIAVDNTLSQPRSRNSPEDVAAENELLRSLIQTKFGLSAQAIEQELKQLQTNALLRDIVKEKLHLEKKQVDAALERAQTDERAIPISAFKTSLSTLEVVVQFLKDSSGMHISEIASLLNRNHRTIWHAYQRSQKKKSFAKVRETSDVLVPIVIFTDRRNSPLEALVAHLHQTHSLSFAEIGRMLLLSRKTIWTVYHRFSTRLNEQ